MQVGRTPSRVRTPLVERSAVNRSRTATFLLAVLAAVALTTAAPAGAAGTGDVELIPSSPDGEPRTSFQLDGSQDEIRFELVNLADEPRTARLYSASAVRSPSGAVSVGSDGSAPWLDLPDEEVLLEAEEVRSFVAPLELRELSEGQTQLGAVVLEVTQGSVVVRVATLVTVEPRTGLPLPVWAVVVAAGAIALVLLGLLLARRRRRTDADEREARELALV